MSQKPALPDLDWYIDRARERANIISDGKLSLGMGMARPTVHLWRQRKSWPDENHMITLCEIAEVDPVQGLVDLRRWCAKGQNKKLWETIRQKLLPVMLLPLFIMAAPMQPAKSASLTQHAGSEVKSDCILCIRRKRKNRFRFPRRARLRSAPPMSFHTYTKLHLETVWSANYARGTHATPSHVTRSRVSKIRCLGPRKPSRIFHP